MIKFILLSILVIVVTTASSIEKEGQLLETKSWCDDVLGCLYLNDSWYSNYRPINVLPRSREQINTRFYLHTRLDPNFNEDYVVSANDLNSLINSPFDPKKATKIVVHGFLDSGNTTWLEDLSRALLGYEDYNVFRVDWGSGSKPMYYQAAANARVVGLEISHLVNTLATSVFRLNPSLVHCIGHSLGAHVCGYAGEDINMLSRITGLDPAGPYFTGTPNFIHLDPSDANFVDVIHTDSDSIFQLGFGTAEPMGNIDFYPNGGHDQPGCNPASVALDLLRENLENVARDVMACSHLRSIHYFQETLKSPHCNWLGHECIDYNSFQTGECFSCSSENTKCAYMGMRSDEYVAKSRQFLPLYLDTDKRSPYCVQHYQVSILTAYPKEAEPWVMGSIYVTIYGEMDEIRKKKITTNHQQIYHGHVTNSLFLSHQDVGRIIRVEIEWNYDDSIVNPGSYCWGLICNRSLYVYSVQVSAINHYPETDRLEYTALTCSLDGSSTKIKDGHSASFLKSTNCEPISS